MENISWINQTTSEPSQFITQKITISFLALFINLDIVAISIIILSRLKLDKTEFYILLINSILQINMKLSLIWYNLSNFVLKINFIIDYFHLSYDIIVSSCFSLSLFYYSLFHLSSLNRSKYFLKLFTMIHNAKTFFLYLTLVFLIFLALALFICLFTYSKVSPDFTLDNQTQDVIFYCYLITIVPTFFPILVYLASIFVVFMTKFGANSEATNRYATTSRNANQLNDHIRFKRNLLLVLKFFLLATIYLIGYLPSNILFFIGFYCPNCFGIALIIFNYFCEFLLFFQPFLLVFIHSILRKTFKLLIQRYI